VADSMEALAGALATELRGILEQAREAPKVPPSNHQTLTVHHADPPRPEPKMAWLAATAAVVGVLVGIVAGFVAFDAKSEVRALRLEVATRMEAAQNRHENDVRELRQKDAAFQAYIITGKVPVKSEPQPVPKK
jgi:hypothetical protein